MQYQYKKMKNLFLRQSYIDAWEDYQRSIRKASFPQWDYIVLTSSNEAQAEAFRSQIAYGVRYDQIEQLCFHTLQKEIFAQSVINQTRKYHIAKNEVKVSLPVRVNWGGGWTDTPPYCNENGGVVLNAAILLRGKKPIEVEIRRIPELRIEFASLDFDAYGKAETVEEIQDCHNPYDSFALHKAALIACGIIPMEGKADLQEILRKLYLYM